MVLELALGFLILAIGLAGALVGWLHPEPSSLRVVKALSWPRDSPDRTDVKLRSTFHIALGAVFLLGTLGGHLAAILAFGAVMLTAGVAIGVRHRAS